GQSDRHIVAAVEQRRALGITARGAALIKQRHLELVERCTRVAHLHSRDRGDAVPAALAFVAVLAGCTPDVGHPKLVAALQADLPRLVVDGAGVRSGLREGDRLGLPVTYQQIDKWPLWEGYLRLPSQNRCAPWSVVASVRGRAVGHRSRAAT